MKRSKLFIVLALMLGIALTLSSCMAWVNDRNSIITGKNPDAQEDEKELQKSTYYMLTFSSGIEYWEDMYKGFSDAASKYGAKVEYTGTTTNDVNQQGIIFDQILSKEPAGIAVSCANSTGLQTLIDNAIKKGVPVVTFDSDAPDSMRYSYISTDNYEAGVLAAVTMAELCDKEGEVGIVQVPDILNQEERTRGFMQTITIRYPDMKVVKVMSGNMDPSEGARAVSAMLETNPNIKGIFCTDATSGVGAVTAIREAKKEPDIKIISFDTDKATLDMIKKGNIEATIAQGTYAMGFWSFESLYYLRGKENVLEETLGKGLSPIPHFMDTGTTIVTKDNVDLFY